MLGGVGWMLSEVWKKVWIDLLYRGVLKVVFVGGLFMFGLLNEVVILRVVFRMDNVVFLMEFSGFLFEDMLRWLLVGFVLIRGYCVFELCFDGGFCWFFFIYIKLI